MNKKAQGLSVNTIVIFVLALLVLVIVAFIFGSQIQRGSKKIINFTEEVETGVTPRGACEQLFSNKKCLPIETCNARGSVDLGIDWADCKKKSTPGHVLHCCK